MIKFFRKIRYDLMENKTGKYFKYAIGEIILVVIGILIALSINNWNEARKSSYKETQFLKSFKKDILANKKELNRVIFKSEETFNASDSILNYKNGKLKNIQNGELFGIIMVGTGFTIYQTHEGTVQDILGSGNLDIIKNDSIRLAIGSWQANLKEIREWEKLDKHSANTFSDYILKHIDLYKMHNRELPLTDENIKELFNDRHFLNYALDRYRKPIILNELYKKESPKLDTLLKTIDNELNDK